MELSEGQQRFISIVKKSARSYIPAMAKGLVSSSTRWPASSPSPYTCIAMKSSWLIDNRLCEEELVFTKRSTNGAKYLFASCRGHMMEHSTGVIERFKNAGCAFGEASSSPYASRASSSGGTSWNKTWRMGFRKYGYRSSGMWTRANRSSYTHGLLVMLELTELNRISRIDSP